MDREDEIMDDVRTLVSTVQGTFTIGNYSASEREIAWARVKARVEQWLAQQA